MSIVERLVNSLVFWGAWITIPLIMEVIPSLGSVFVLIKQRIAADAIRKPTLYPEISIIIPVYNSSDTLEACIRSINDSYYDNQRIGVYLVNNQGTDDSFSVYARCQKLFPDLHMQWLNSQQGKAKALNLAIYNSAGKYVVHIDSDGVLEPSALTYLVDKFEHDPTINVMTGTILTNPEKISEYPAGLSRLVRKMEFMEYAQAFLAGRNSDANFNAIYTLSGAFSAFRKSAILKSRMYNANTICEDTHITFQMRYLQHEKVKISERSIFFVDPIESMDRLYTQRQRWQRGSLEVSKLFENDDKLRTHKMLSDINVRTLMFDHTFAFPRMIWYLALICLMFVGYSGRVVLLANVFLFGLYTFCGFLYYISACGFLSRFKSLRNYYARQWYIVPLLPLFNMMVFFMRLAGIVNSVGTDSTWRTRTLSEEKEDLKSVFWQDMSKARKVLEKLHGIFNGDPEVMYGPKTLEQKLRGSAWKYIVFFLACFISVTIIAVCRWSAETFQISLTEIVNTLLGNLQGTGGDTVERALRSCLPPMILAVAAVGGLILFDRMRTRKLRRAADNEKNRKRIKRLLRLRTAAAACACLLVITSIAYANYCYDFVGYVMSNFSSSYIYEQYYVDPESAAIYGDNTKNLIWIYIESMETTYADQANGGFQDINLIPNLTQLAEENLSFSIAETGAGGFYSNHGSTWTMAALYSTASGVPYALPASDATLSKQSMYASGLTTLGEILKEKGYTNEFLCGSDINFANRGAFLTQHGDYEILDYKAAIKRGYIPSNYHEWWGFEDAKLYEIAKQEATRLAAEDRRFNLTILTADTHFPDGYICDLCQDDHPEVAGNVVACADRQVGDFIRWCKTQPFFKDTVIVICGDHPRMDAVLVRGVKWENRRVYDCFINAANEEAVTNKNRRCAALDMFPTTLSAMGFSIEGDRLGLGTNLFSDVPTLAETMGFAQLDSELNKHSEFYINKFAPELIHIVTRQEG